MQRPADRDAGPGTGPHTGGGSAKSPALASEALAIDRNYVLDAIRKNSLGDADAQRRRPCSAAELKSA